MNITTQFYHTTGTTNTTNKHMNAQTNKQTDKQTKQVGELCQFYPIRSEPQNSHHATGATTNMITKTTSKANKFVNSVNFTPEELGQSICITAEG